MLLSALPASFQAIEHIGSTAVPGAQAKPIIDMIGGVSSMDLADEMIPQLVKIGWDTSAEFNQKIGERRFLLQWPGGVRTLHLHLVVFGGPIWRDAILFRDHLRADPGIRLEYERLKESLAKSFPDDREGYTD